MADAYAGRYFSTVTNVWESALGHTGAPRAQLWAWQPSSLSLQPVTLDNTGSLITSATLSGNAGNAAAGNTGIAPPTSADYTGWNNAGTFVGVSAATPLPVGSYPTTSGGLTPTTIVSAAGTNLTGIKGSAGQVYHFSAQNVNAAARYLKVFDAPVGSVTIGTTPAKYQYMIPGNTAGAGMVVNIDKGMAHASGISVAITGGIGLTDSTAISANEVVVTVGYS